MGEWVIGKTLIPPFHYSVSEAKNQASRTHYHFNKESFFDFTPLSPSFQYSIIPVFQLGRSP